MGLREIVRLRRTAHPLRPVCRAAQILAAAIFACLFCSACHRKNVEEHQRQDAALAALRGIQIEDVIWAYSGNVSTNALTGPRLLPMETAAEDSSSRDRQQANNPPIIAAGRRIIFQDFNKQLTKETYDTERKKSQELGSVDVKGVSIAAVIAFLCLLYLLKRGRR